MRLPAAALAALALAGCSAGGGGSAASLPGPEAVREAPERAREAGTASFSATYERQPEGEAAERYLGTEGTLDLAAGAGTMRADLVSLFPEEVVPEELEEPIELEWTREELRAPALGEQAVPRAQWDDAGLLGRLVREPAGVVELLGRARDVREVGVEDVDGRETRRFAFAVDPRAAGEASVPADLAPLLREGGVERPLALEAWLDARGLPLRVVYALELEPVESEGRRVLPARTITARYEFREWGRGGGG